MTPEETSTVVELLVAMEVYKGPQEAFVQESVTQIMGELRCSREEADRILKDLVARKVIDFDLQPARTSASTLGWRWKRRES
jgi:hypothetical protein